MYKDFELDSDAHTDETIDALRKLTAITDCARCHGSTLNDDSAILTTSQGDVFYICTKCVSAMWANERCLETGSQSH